MEQNYIVSARKYRPSTFASVVGQAALTQTLRNAIANDRLAHAYLFCGSRGVGKTSCARIFAKTINCEHRTPDGEACNECESCREFNRGNSLNIVELDAASNNGVDDIRELTEQVAVPPVNARYRVFIIDEVHMLTSSAFNAFLKTLEEPPAYVVFILATTEKHKVIPTILSRCQIYDFNRITIADTVNHLRSIGAKEGIVTEDAALDVIARKADGAMRDALSIFDQVVASTLGNVTYRATIDNLNILDYEYYDRLTEAFLAGDVPTALLIYKEIRDRGFDSLFFVNGLAQHMRDLMVASHPSTLTLLEASDEARAAMAAVAAKCSPAFLYKAMDLCNEADLNYRTATSKQLLVELLLIKLCQQLSPSPTDSGAGGGQLRPIAQPRAAAPQSTPASSPTPAPRSPAPAPRPQAASAPIVSDPQAPYTPAAPRPDAPKRRTSGLRTPSVSLRGVTDHAAHDSGNVTPAAAGGVKRSRDFTDGEFAAAWQAVIERHPKEHLLVNAMRLAHPERTAVGSKVFRTTVESEAIRDSIEAARPTVVNELRELLGDDGVTLEVALDKGRATATSLTDAEAYAVMRKNHPYLNTLAADLKLTLI